MAISINSSLRFSPAHSIPKLEKNISRVASPHNPESRKEPIWSKQAIPGLACVVLGFGVGFFNSESGVYAIDSGAAVESERVLRWSEKRKCPQWHENSLENFVPENLPRPWSHRKSEAIGLKSQSAPAVSTSIEVNNNCYSV